MPKLTNRRYETFAQHYAANHVGSKAARAAGISQASCRSRATEWLRRPDIRARIDELDTRAIREAELDGKRIKTELARIALVDPRDLFYPDGSPRHPSDWSDDLAAAVKSIEVSQTKTLLPQGKDDDGQERPPIERVETTTKIRLWDKNAALRVLAVHFRVIGIDPDESLGAQRSMGERMAAAQRRLERRGLRLVSNRDDAAAA